MKYPVDIKKVNKKLVLLATVVILMAAGLACTGAPQRGWSGPTLEDGTIYFGTTEGKLFAVDKESRGKKWEFPAPGESGIASACSFSQNKDILLGVYSNPVPYDRYVFFSGYNGKVYGVEKESGLKWWEYKTEGPIIGSVAIASGLVLFGSSDDYFYAVSATNAKNLKWKFKTGGKIWSTPAVKDNIVVFGSFDKNVYAVDINSGQKIWQFKTGGAIAGDPVIAGDTVYIGSFDNNLYALDLKTGTEKWKFAGQGWFWMTPAVKDGTVFAGSFDRRIYAIDSRTGTKKWDFISGGIIQSTPVIIDNFLVIGSTDKKLYLLNSDDGKVVKESRQFESEILADLFVTGKTVYLYTKNQVLYEVEVPSLNEKTVYQALSK